MATPDEVTVWVGLDVGKENHFAAVLDDAGDELFAGPVGNDEADIDAVLERACGHGTAGLVIDQPGSIAQLAIAVAAQREVPVAYVPGLVMRRAADLYPGEAKTDRRDAFVIADTGRTRRRQVHWLDATSDELLAQLRVLNGFDIDLVRLTNRLRDALVSISVIASLAANVAAAEPTAAGRLVAAWPPVALLLAELVDRPRRRGANGVPAAASSPQPRSADR